MVKKKSFYKNSNSSDVSNNEDMITLNDSDIADSDIADSEIDDSEIDVQK